MTRNAGPPPDVNTAMALDFLRRGVGLVLLLGLAGCESAASAPPTAEDLPSSSAPPLSASPSPAAASAEAPATTTPFSISEPGSSSAPEEWVDVAIPTYVAFAGQPVAMDATSSETGGPTRLLLASATIDFGDGTSATHPGSCRSLVRFTHRYRAAGDYRPHVIAITSCDPGVVGHLSGPLQTVHVLPAAPAVSADWPACSPSELRMAGFAAGVGLGNAAARITLTNAAERGCVLEGYPGIVLVAGDGSNLPTDARPATTGAYLFPAVVPDRVALAPGNAASFMVGYTDNPFGPNASKPYDIACPASSAVRVILPGQHTSGVARVAMRACGGLMEVSPLVPGAEGLGLD